MARERIVVGIDVGTTKVCTLIAAVSPEDQLEIIGAGITPSRGMRRGVVVDVDEAVQAIAASVQKAEQQSGFKIMSAFVGISGAHISSANSHGVVAVRRTDNVITDDDVERALEAAKVVNMPHDREVIHVVPRHFVIDGQEGHQQPGRHARTAPRSRDDGRDGHPDGDSQPLALHRAGRYGDRRAGGPADRRRRGGADDRREGHGRRAASTSAAARPMPAVFIDGSISYICVDACRRQPHLQRYRDGAAHAVHGSRRDQDSPRLRRLRGRSKRTARSISRRSTSPMASRSRGGRWPRSSRLALKRRSSWCVTIWSALASRSGASGRDGGIPGGIVLVGRHGAASRHPAAGGECSPPGSDRHADGDVRAGRSDQQSGVRRERRAAEVGSDTG